MYKINGGLPTTVATLSWKTVPSLLIISFALHCRCMRFACLVSIDDAIDIVFIVSVYTPDGIKRTVKHTIVLCMHALAALCSVRLRPGAELH